MDAKAKVVATLRLTEFVSYYWETSVPVYEMPLEAYIPLTDHEAALAELQSFCDGLVYRIDEERTKHATLLSGLEALAEQWDRDAEEDRQRGAGSNCPSDVFANELRRNLASAGLEGKTDGR